MSFYVPAATLKTLSALSRLYLSCFGYYCCLLSKLYQVRQDRFTTCLSIYSGFGEIGAINSAFKVYLGSI